MEEFQAPPPSSSHKSYYDGRNLELVNPSTLRSIQKVYITKESSPRSRPPSFDHHRRIPHKITTPNKSSSSSLKGWWNDPEVKRKRRVAKYKLYCREGKVKGSIRQGYNWVKIQCSKLVHGF